MRIRSEDQRASSVERAAFTLLELVVVIAIILVLVAITAAAVGKVVSAQRVSNTKAALQKVNGELLRQWQAVIDQAKSETPSPGIMTMANQDPIRATVILTKLRLRAAFPQSITEYLSPPAGAPLGQEDLLHERSYLDIFTQAGVDSGVYASNKQLQQQDPGICIWLTLNLGRRGAVSQTALLGGLTLAKTPFPPLQSVVDAWGTPLSFYRFPWDPNAAVAINTAANPASVDPIDPTGTLLDPRWHGVNGANNSASAPNNGVFWFEALCHKVSIGTPGTGGYSPASYNSSPVLVSAGPDQILGLDPSTMTVYPSGNSAANDNLYSNQP